MTETPTSTIPAVTCAGCGVAIYADRYRPQYLAGSRTVWRAETDGHTFSATCAQHGPGETGRYTLMAGGADGGWTRHAWMASPTVARLYADRYALPGDLLVGPGGETLHRY